MDWEPNWREDEEALDELESVLIRAPEYEESEDESDNATPPPRSEPPPSWAVP